VRLIPIRRLVHTVDANSAAWSAGRGHDAQALVVTVDWNLVLALAVTCFTLGHETAAKAEPARPIALLLWMLDNAAIAESNLAVVLRNIRHKISYRLVVGFAFCAAP